MNAFLPETPVKRDVGYYARCIDLCWNRAIEGIIAMGWLIAEARMELSPLEWRRLIAEHCPFDLTVACRLMRIASDQRITDQDIQRHLPPSWDKLYQLVTLEETTFRRALDAGVIHPAMSGSEITLLKRSVPKSATAPAVVNWQVRLYARLQVLLREFPQVDSLTARISDPKSEVAEISVDRLRDLPRAA